uniref:Uncharacterized protein n=1 Tax=Oryza sativa subsp. japonica TaxID=39947 RepID=Q7F1T2_ORYSJ|nr:hypothetical protein [Oryza sativa Japonica Group]
MNKERILQIVKHHEKDGARSRGLARGQARVRSSRRAAEGRRRRRRREKRTIFAAAGRGRLGFRRRAAVAGEEKEREVCSFIRVRSWRLGLYW